MLKRKKIAAVSSEKKEANARKKKSVLTDALILRARRRAVVWVPAIVGLLFLAAEAGCSCGLKCWGRREKKVETADVLAQTETALCVDGRVARMEIAKNSKRILVELRDSDEAPEDAYSEFFASGGRRTPSDADAGTPCVELWNVEFLEARRETLDAAQEDGVGTATFDETGTRVFWTTREIDRSGKFASTTAEDGATRNKIASIAATIPAERANYASKNAWAYRENVEAEGEWRPASRNVLATRALEKSTASAAQAETRGSAARLKISEEAKEAETVWLSPNARWIVGRVASNAWKDEVGEVERTGEDASNLRFSEWTLTLRRDRRRVVRFPETVKMTFAESTSNETVEGRIVDVLAVSPAGDLVATLVEEISSSFDAASEGEIAEAVGDGEFGRFGEFAEFDKLGELGEGARWVNVGATKEFDEDFTVEANDEDYEECEEREEYADFASVGESENAEFSGRADFIPRFKIVVWDLSVAETVDWEKAKKPLQALEVAQIAVSGPVSRRFCRFSPNGQIFAARIDPRYITLWQAANGRLLVELGEHRADVSDFAFSPNGMKVAAATGLGARVVLWNVRKGAAHRALDETAPGVDEIDAVAFSPDGGSVYFANNLGEIKRWNARAERRAAPVGGKD